MIAPIACQDLFDLIERSDKIVVLLGAGASVDANIQCFRTANNHYKGQDKMAWAWNVKNHKESIANVLGMRESMLEGCPTKTHLFLQYINTVHYNVVQTGFLILILIRGGNCYTYLLKT